MKIQECIIGYSYEWMPNNRYKNNLIPKIQINHKNIKLQDIKNISCGLCNYDCKKCNTQ
jgi:hypothetical protein